MAIMTDELNESGDDIEIVPANNNSTRKLNPSQIQDEFNDISAINVKKLKGAYRHPFEYISPVLYRKDIKADDSAIDLKPSDLYVASEEEFNRLSTVPVK